MNKLIKLFSTPYILMNPAMAHLIHDNKSTYNDYKAAIKAEEPYNSGKKNKYIGLINIEGVIDYKDSFMLWAFGGTSIENVKEKLIEMNSDPEISSIILRIDSPGGGVTGVQELAATIRKVRENKLVYAIADGMAASAAYWLGSQASEFSVIPSGEVGSIGVYTMHTDLSKYYENEGIKFTPISAGDYKVEGNPYEELDEEAKAYLQYQVDKIYERFLEDVALGRQVGVEEVKESFGKGRMVMAKDAQKLAMVDHIETVDELVSRIFSRKQNDTFKIAKAKAKLI